MTITVYSTPGCVQCTATTRHLDREGAGDYDVVDLTQNPDALAYVRSLGHQQAPVIVAGDEHWSGYRPDKITAALRAT